MRGSKQQNVDWTQSPRQQPVHENGVRAGGEEGEGL